jgi:hypothetical protein
MTMTTFEDIKKIALELKDKKGVAEIKAVLRRYCQPEYPKLADIPVHLYDDVMADLIVLRDGRKVQGYAYNSTVSPAPAVVVHGVGIKHYIPGDEIKTLHPEPDNTAGQVESLTMKSVNRCMEGICVVDRASAQKLVEVLQRKWDLINDKAVMESLMERMEERHGEEFNAFFEATVRQVMLASGLQQVKINTSDILLTLANGTAMRVREEPGFLIYELVEDNDA